MIKTTNHNGTELSLNIIGKDEAGNQWLFHPAAPNVNQSSTCQYHRQCYATQQTYQEVNEATDGKANLNCSTCHVINFRDNAKMVFCSLIQSILQSFLSYLHCNFKRFWLLFPNYLLTFNKWWFFMPKYCFSDFQKNHWLNEDMELQMAQRKLLKNLQLTKVPFVN